MVLNSLQAGLVRKRAGHLVLWFILIYCSYAWIVDFYFLNIYIGSGTLYSLKSRQTRLFFRMSMISWWMSSLPVVQFRMPRSRTAIAARAGRMLCSLVLVRRTWKSLTSNGGVPPLDRDVLVY